MITIAIAEDHQSLIDGIELFLNQEPNFKIIGQANDGEHLLELVRKNQPHVVITDIRMPKIDGIEATRQLKTEFPNIKVIAFSMFDNSSAIQQMHAAGASGYILKNSSLQEIVTAINTVYEGNQYYDPNLDISMLSKTSLHQAKQNKSILSKSEMAILRLIAQNKTSSEIATQRFTAISTVEKHRKNMMRKLGLSGKGELLKYALERKYEF